MVRPGAGRTRFAVRSSGIGEDSAGHSFAGMHETLLNVERDRWSTRCWRAGVGAARREARAYREARGLPRRRARIARVVQIMVPAVTSGVAFTINPITGADEIVINAARGLGEALVSGQIDPDEYRVRKRDASVLRSRARGAGRHRRAVVATARRAGRAADPNRAPLRCAAGRRVVPRRSAVLDRPVASGHDPHPAPRHLQTLDPSPHLAPRSRMDPSEPRRGAARSDVAAGARGLRRDAQSRRARVLRAAAGA